MTDRRAKLTPKQRVQRRYPNAYCMRHFDLSDLWCVFLRRKDRFATVCEFSVHKAWIAARASYATGQCG